MSEHTLLPWHQDIYQPLLHAWQRQRLPHALLLSGVTGMGKLQFARRLAAGLLCMRPNTSDGEPCGECKSCHLLHAGNHTDFYNIEPEEPGKQLKIDQIRRLIERFTLSAQYDGYRVALIHPAESMNIATANSLLKLLEEPPPQSLLILVSHHPARLLATIRSRCQTVHFKAAARAQCEDFIRQHSQAKDIDPGLLLDLSQQAPFAALQLVGKLRQRQQLFQGIEQLLEAAVEPIACAGDWGKHGAQDCIEWMSSITMDFIRRHYSGHDINNRDMPESLLDWAKRINLDELFRLLDKQHENYALLSSTANIRPQNLLEDLAMEWLATGLRARKR